ncbi:uncharacterized protein [Ptychodera flava]|uniref:uncharacterized protein n=1 Tax=Ptychodera flava TaxID=63121 RepID=UPI00396A8CC4
MLTFSNITNTHIATHPGWNSSTTISASTMLVPNTPSSGLQPSSFVPGKSTTQLPSLVTSLASTPGSGEGHFDSDTFAYSTPQVERILGNASTQISNDTAQFYVTTVGGTGHTDSNSVTNIPPPDWSHIHIAVLVVTLGIPLLTFAVFILCRLRVVLVTRHRYNQMQKCGNLGLSTISLATSATTLVPRSSPKHCQTYGNTLAPPSALPPPISLASDARMNDCDIENPEELR